MAHQFDDLCSRALEDAGLRGRPSDVLAVPPPIWREKPETAKRLRGRIERVLDAAKVEGHRQGENLARWRGHLEHTLLKPGKLSRGHHPAPTLR